MFKRTMVILTVLFLIVGGLAFAERFERSETMYMIGGLWGPPSNFNPLTPWNAHPGIGGGIYETLYAYDPISDSLYPWLAESGEWTDEKTYELKLRKGIKWTDGHPFTAEDVAYTFSLPGQMEGIHYSDLYGKMDEIKVVDDHTVVFKFNDPTYHEWGFQLYQIYIVPKHIWENKDVKEITMGSNDGKCIGTGEYMLEGYTQDRIVYLRNDNWWGNEVFGTPKPKRIVYLKAISNNVALGMMMKGEEMDLANTFLPGIPAIKNAYGIHTYFDEAPYMLSDNTAFLFINTEKPGLNDARVRKAMAFAINSDEIVKRVFENMVLPSNPLGLLPIEGWMKYYDEKVVAEKGFSYNPEKAKALLAEAGLKDINKDGFVELQDGKEFKVEIIVPFGWTDWMESIKIIAKNLQAIGINAEAKFPDYNKYFDDLTSGSFDLGINNNTSKATSTPWTIYNWLFANLIGNRANNGNYSRYVDSGIKSIIDEFNRTPMDEVEKGKAVLSELEEICLDEMPFIPLWYNGLWFESNTQVWSNWPSSETDTNPNYPCAWANRWQDGLLKLLTKIDLK